jgi:hypothetical protein
MTTRLEAKIVPTDEIARHNFPRIEITGIFTPNVSSQARRRNKSPGHETIFCFSCRHPETQPD